jgi:hypothetical protein
VQEQLTGTSFEVLKDIYDRVPFEVLEQAMEMLCKQRRMA